MNKQNGLMPIRSRKHNKKHTYFHYIGKMVNQVIQFFHVLGKTTTHKHSSATARKHFRFRASHHHHPHTCPLKVTESTTINIFYIFCVHTACIQKENYFTFNNSSPEAAACVFSGTTWSSTWVCITGSDIGETRAAGRVVLSLESTSSPAVSENQQIITFIVAEMITLETSNAKCKVN